MKRHMNHFEEDILIVGAGLSGISAACHLQKELPKRRFTILERRTNIGGTWDLFRYPGIRSDSDMFSFGFKFKPWRNAHFFSQGADIRDYVQEAATENKVFDHIRFQRKVVSADWNSRAKRWIVKVVNEATGEEETYRAKFFWCCAGYYNYDKGYKPDFPGEDTFKGQIVHPQHWPEGLDYTGKRVVVIGSGATAVTLVPSMVDKAARVTMLQRSPSYIFSLPSVDAITQVLQKTLPANLAYKLNRTRTIGLAHVMFKACKSRPAAMRKFILKMVARQLKGSTVDIKHFSPSYMPWDQRLCLVPDGDFFKALRGGKADVVTDHIERFEPEGIRLKSGELLEADLIVTATGLNVQMVGGMNLMKDGVPVNLGQKMFYKSVLLQDVPNAAVVLGYTHASWTLKSDLAAGFVCRLLKHMDKHGLTVATPHAGEVPVVNELTVLGGLSSNYLKRVADQLPRQGATHPWRNKQDYYHDQKVLLKDPVDEDGLMFA
ncbi:NAD(P)/FAD-dependent oxidoreductase [Limnobacter humi]|uniref:NAD(P)/FAD-dependent oxidoreductase n=1 Tax=Limnobacter humi TaxID=1778671 RepID=A0ABT1WHK9_9BURK|nr:NAD(P)/FAD-dependent oxidoreductase [Limnobacter humi]